MSSSPTPSTTADRIAPKNPTVGLAYALLSVVLFAISPTLAKLSYLDNAGPLTAGIFRGALLCLVFSVPLYRLARNGLFPVGAAGRIGEGRERVKVLLWLGFSYAAFAWSYQTAILHAGAGLSLVSATAAAIPVVLWHTLNSRTGGRRRAAALYLIPAALTLIGASLLAEDAGLTKTGAVLCLLSMLSCAAMTLATEAAVDAGIKPMERSGIIGLGMLLLLLPLYMTGADYRESDRPIPRYVPGQFTLGQSAPGQHAPECRDISSADLVAPCVELQAMNPFAFPGTLQGWLAFLGSALTMIAAISLYSAAIGHMGAIRVSLIANAEPALGLAIAWLWAREALGPLGVLGGALACAGLIDWKSLQTKLRTRFSRPPA